MKLYSLVLPLLIFGLFGYGVSVLERSQVEGVVEGKVAKAVVKEDFRKVDAFMKTGASANHKRYNE